MSDSVRPRLGAGGDPQWSAPTNSGHTATNTLESTNLVSVLLLCASRNNDRLLYRFSRTYVREICPQIRVSFFNVNLRTAYLASSCCFRKTGAYTYIATVRKFALFPT